MSKSPHPLILIADDDPQFLRIMEHHLRTWSYQVECVSDKARLLEYLAGRRVDLLLLDVRFGEHDGVEILRQIKADLPDLRVTMLTAFGSIGNAVTAINFGAIEYLTKPVDLNQLRAVLAHTLGGPKEASARPAVVPAISAPIEADVPAAPRPDELREIDRVEKEAIVRALAASGGNVVEAAKSLGLGQATVYRKIKKYKIVV